MIRIPAIVIEEISYALGDGTDDLLSLAQRAVRGLRTREIGGVIAATFSNAERFPALSIRLAAELKLPSGTPAFDLQMACSAYPYALYAAGRLAADTGRRILVVNGDVQSRLVDPSDHATGHIFSDAVAATVVSSDSASPATSAFDFLSRADEALACSADGPIRMDGMKVFTFVATEVRAFLKDFLSRLPDGIPAHFVPHQANPYMVRQLAKSLALEDRLVTLDESIKNPGSSSIPIALARSGQTGTVLVAGFGAGYSAAVGTVTYIQTTSPK